MPTTQERIDALLERTVVSPNGCRLFTGCIQANGYGRATISGKTDYAHRHMYRLFHGHIPQCIDVCHWCDVRACINPHHLFLGTRADNMADAVRKGRQAKGTKLPHTKLSDVDKKNITNRARSGEMYESIARDFGICRQHAGQIAIKNGVMKYGIRK